jgi:malonate decarboxylase epsilon subunit
VSVALLFPGQGAQRPGMLDGLPQARSLVAEAGLPWPLDTADALRDTIATQVCLVIAGVAGARSLLDRHGMTVSHVAGHSVGAFAAAVVAGVLTLSDAVTAVTVRGRAMRDACAGGDWGMAAVTGLRTRTATEIADRIAQLWVANINSATQTVLAGTASALDVARDAARQAGASGFERLDVAIASHGPLQESTAAALRAHLANLRPPAAAMGYLTNVGGRVVRTADAVLADLADSVAHPVRWYDGMRLLGELGVDRMVEAPPGHTLTRLAAAIDPHVQAFSLAEDPIDTILRRTTSP